GGLSDCHRPSRPERNLPLLQIDPGARDGCPHLALLSLALAGVVAGGMIRRHAKASSATGFVPRPTPLCSQRTNRNRANQRVAILNDRFTSCCAPDVTERLH